MVVTGHVAPLQVRPDGHVALTKMDTSPSMIFFLNFKCLMLNVISMCIYNFSNNNINY